MTEAFLSGRRISSRHWRVVIDSKYKGNVVGNGLKCVHNGNYFDIPVDWLVYEDENLVAHYIKPPQFYTVDMKDPLKDLNGATRLIVEPKIEITARH